VQWKDGAGGLTIGESESISEISCLQGGLPGEQRAPRRTEPEEQVTLNGRSSVSCSRRLVRDMTLLGGGLVAFTHHSPAAQQLPYPSP
jgi:hypothetical protein